MAFGPDCLASRPFGIHRLPHRIAVQRRNSHDRAAPRSPRGRGTGGEGARGQGGLEANATGTRTMHQQACLGMQCINVFTAREILHVRTYLHACGPFACMCMRAHPHVRTIV